MIIAIRSDSPAVYIGVLSAGGTEQATRAWEAGRELSTQILPIIDDLLQSVDGAISKVEGIIVYQGPGSYTGLRIGISVANALAYSNEVPVVGCTGENWLQAGVEELQSADSGRYISPEYGGEVRTTKPRK